MSDVPTNAPRSTSGDGVSPRVVTFDAVTIEETARAAYYEWQNGKDFPRGSVPRESLETAMEALGRLLNMNVR